MRTLLFLLPLLALFLTVDSYKVLVYSTLFGHSHVKMVGTVADTITDAGHNVTVLMPILDAGEINRTGLKTTKNVIFVEQAEKAANVMNMMKEFLANLWRSSGNNPLMMVLKSRPMAELFADQCEAVISKTELLEQLRNENFDLGVAEPFDECAYVLFEAINIRAHVSVLSASRMDHVSDAIGQPIAPSYVPGTQSLFGDRMGIYERFMNVLQYFSGSYMFSYIGDYEYEQLKDVAKIKRSWREVLPESTFVFTNHITLLDFPSPSLDKIIPIGGIQVKRGKSANKLAEKWDKILGIRQKNVLISFGSNAKSIHMPEEYKQSLLRVMQSMPDVSFIWKYEDDTATFANHLDNVYLGSWLPQNELLADKRLTLFLTHGGLGSTTELALMGKPCVMVPLFADQGRNAQMLKRHGGATVFHKTDLGDWELVRRTIDDVLNNESYRQNAERLAEILNNQPTDPKETLIKHVEFAARFGKMPTMDPYGRHQSFIEFYLLDVIAVGLLITSLVLYISFRTVIFVFSKCCRKNQKPKND